ncbi:MAG: hypothetical protein WCV62_06100 [Candidatus Peribacteraceae bacterium]|jgi:ethanolamine transporter EutH
MDSIIWVSLALTVVNAFLLGFNLRSALDPANTHTKLLLASVILGGVAVVVCGTATVLHTASL